MRRNGFTLIELLVVIAVIAIIEGKPFSPADQVEIRSILRQTLTKYETPRTFYFLPTLPETPTGKIDRVACLQQIAPTSTKLLQQAGID